MARPGLDKHVKFRKAVRMLGEPEPHFRGYLETLWEVAYENGNPVIGDAEAIEAAAKYPGEPGRLFKVLLECGGIGRAGFIEPTDHPDEYQIHDLFDHAPEYVKKRQKRESERKSNGVGENGGQRRTLSDNGAPPGTRHPAPAPSTQIPVPVVPVPVSKDGAFADLEESDLHEASKVMAWIDRQQLKPNPVVSSSTADRLNVMAAAVKARSTKNARGRVAVFSGIVAKKLWGNLTPSHEDIARRELVALDSPARQGPRNGLRLRSDDPEPVPLRDCLPQINQLLTAGAQR